MIRIHLYDTKGFLADTQFPKFPVNSYETSNIDTVLDELRDLLNNHDSGISKILIENSEFDTNTYTHAQNIYNLDK